MKSRCRGYWVPAFAVAVGEKLDLVAGARRFLPGIHDEVIVDAGDGDRVDALLLDGVGVLDEAGQVALVAGAGEGAGDAEENNFLALEQLVRGFPRRTFARHHAQLRRGNGIADLDGHQFSSGETAARGCRGVCAVN